MKKLTAGIFTVLIGLCAANSADATVASSAWVNEKVSALATTVSNNATTAAAETKAVADDLAAYIESNDAAVDLKAAQADLDATNTLVGTLPADAGADTIVGYIQKRTEGIATDAALGELQGQVTTNATNIGLNTTAIATLNGSGDGSVSKSIADALTAYTNTEGVDAKVKVVSDALDTHVAAADGKYATITDLNAANQAIAGLESSKEAVANKVSDFEATSSEDKDSTTKYPTTSYLTDAIEALNTTTVQTTNSLASSLTSLGNTVVANKTAAAEATKAVADDLAAYKTENDAAVSTNTSAIATINDANNGILAQAKAYAKEQADAASGSASGVASDLSEFKTTVGNTYATQESLGTTNTNVTNLTTRVSTNETNIAGLQSAINDEETGLLKKVADNAAAAKDAADAASENLAKINAQAALISTNATNISKNADAIEAEVTRAKAAEAANATAALNAQKTADAAIPAPTGDCSNPTNKCVLTYNNATYTWEVIERANGEVVE